MNYNRYKSDIKRAKYWSSKHTGKTSSLWFAIADLLAQLLPILFDEDNKFKPLRLYQFKRIWKIASITVSVIALINKGK